MADAVMTLAGGRERSLLRRHPWIFSGAVKSVTGAETPGETLRVVSEKGGFLGFAAWSPDSQLTGRVWSFDERETIGEAFFRKRIRAAVALRRTLGVMDPEGGCRLIYSESDGLPGIVVDRYANVLVLQLLSAGADYWRETLAKVLMEECNPSGIYERSDASIRRKEGLAPREGWISGGGEGKITISEGDMRFQVDFRKGQKTGFYFDLRDARTRVRQYAAGRKMLNAFSYTGALAVAALKGGATSVLNLDSSVPALEQGAENLALNNLESASAEFRRCDVFEELRRLDAQKERFDLIVLDPPKLIDSKNALMRGCRAYQDLARLGFKLLNPGGILFNFSCSGLMDAELFQKITAAAAVEAKVEPVIIGRVDQAGDHPVAEAVPETRYLKGLISALPAASQD